MPQIRLGCSLLRGDMDASGSTTPHQLSSVEGNFPNFPVISENLEWIKCTYQVRQLYSNGLCEQGGKYCNDTALFIST